MRHARLVLLGLVLGLAVDVGSAANVGLVARPLQAGSAAVSACGSAASFSMTYTTNGSGAVTAVVVTGIPSGCIGGQIRATLVNSAAAVQASGGPVTIAGASATIAVTPNPLASAVTRTDLIVVGP
jgi:hypothetical protein